MTLSGNNSPSERRCDQCGQRLEIGATVCPNCGRTVKPASNPAEPSTLSGHALEGRALSSQAPGRSSPPAPARGRGCSLPLVLGAAGCLTLVFIAAVALGFFVFGQPTGLLTGPAAPTAVGVLRAAPATPAPASTDTLDTPAPDPTATAVQPTQSNPLGLATRPPGLAPTLSAFATPAPGSPEFNGAWSEDTGQTLAGTSFTDDFSSPAFAWATADEEALAWGIQDGRYRLRLTQKDALAWAYLPVDFQPGGVGFDAAVQPGFSQGSYGVLCHFQDEDNYHYVAIDPVNAEYAIGRVQNGEDLSLLENWWQPAQYLRGSPTAINQVQVECRPERIALYLNGQLEADVALKEAPPTGRVALYGETWEDLPGSGFEVDFDNVYAYR